MTKTVADRSQFVVGLLAHESKSLLIVLHRAVVSHFVSTAASLTSTVAAHKSFRIPSRVDSQTQRTMGKHKQFQ